MAYGNSFQRSSPVVLNLIIINVLVFFAQSAFGDDNPTSKVSQLFALHHYKSEFFQPHQLVTHMFMHGGLLHLLFNMLGLWMFGSTIEKVWGPKRFLIFYFLCGIGAGIAQLLAYAYDFRGITEFTDPQMYVISQYTATVGASGAVMGILAAFAYLFPNSTLFIMPIPFPVKAKWAILGIIAIDIFSGISRVQGDNIAHFAHVGGAVIGFIIVYYWNKTNKRTFY